MLPRYCTNWDDGERITHGAIAKTGEGLDETVPARIFSNFLVRSVFDMLLEVMPYQGSFSWRWLALTVNLLGSSHLMRQMRQHQLIRVR